MLNICYVDLLIGIGASFTIATLKLGAIPVCICIFIILIIVGDYLSGHNRTLRRAIMESNVVVDFVAIEQLLGI
jgi:hypothetical protein